MVTSRITKDQHEEGNAAWKESKGHWLKDEFRINKKLLPLKLALFLYVGGVTSFLPYLTLHMKEVGLDITQIGFVYAVLPASAILGPAITGIIADKSGRYTAVLTTTIFLTASFHTFLLFIPSYKPNILQFKCSPQDYSVKWNRCGNDFFLSNYSDSAVLQDCKYSCSNEPNAHLKMCFSRIGEREIDCFDDIIMNNTDEIEVKLTSLNANDCSHSLEDIRFRNASYDLITCPTDGCPIICSFNDVTLNRITDSEWSSPEILFCIYVVVRTLATLSLAACYCMLDAVVLAKVKETGGEFGKQRMVSLISQATAPLMAGILVDYFNEDGKRDIDYSAAFYLGDALLLAAIVILSFTKLEVEKAEGNILKDLGKLLTRIEIDIFLCIITFLGICWGFLETYLFLYLEDLGAPTYLLGLTLTVGCASGIPAMFVSDLIVEKVGRGTIFCMSFIAYFIRFVGYSYLPSAWYCFPYEMLEVITYQIFWVAAATYCPVLAPANLLATMTSIAGAAHYSLGRGLGSLIGGTLIANFGLRITFRSIGYAALVGAVFQIFAQKVTLHKKIKQKEKLMAFANAQDETNIKMERASIPAVAMLQNSSRKSSLAM